MCFLCAQPCQKLGELQEGSQRRMRHGPCFQGVYRQQGNKTSLKLGQRKRPRPVGAPAVLTSCPGPQGLRATYKDSRMQTLLVAHIQVPSPTMFLAGRATVWPNIPSSSTGQRSKS